MIANSSHFIILSLVYMCFLCIVFNLKKHIDTIELKIFKILLFFNIFGLIMELMCIYCASGFGGNSSINLIFNRLYLLYLNGFCLLFLNYITSVAIGDEKYNRYKQKIISLSVLAFVIFGFLSTILPLDVYVEHGMYSTGPAVVVVYALSILSITIGIALMIKNIKTVRLNKYTPLFVLIIGLTIATIIQNISPQFTLITTIESFVLLVMYFTIENPDMKIIQQLNIARDQADKANNAKSEFLSSMSHEIRTPLNAIVGFSQALSEEELPYQAKEEVKDIMMACDTLLDIVNGILDISKIEANKLEIVDTEYNFNQVLEELVALTKARLGEKPLDFRYSFSEDIPKYMYGDKMRVKQIILNLLTNAVKYTKEGYIEFKVNCVKKDDICRLIISVQDSGIGIKQESIDKLFTRFERLDVEKNNTIEGTGLGLAITKKLLELMGGQIVVQSVYGKGSKFTVAIDQKIVENPTNPALERTQTLDLNAIKNIDLTNKRILIVDDNKINLKVAARLLQDYHCIIDTLDSGFDCIDKISKGASYDLILMDDMMPKMSGVETFKKLKENNDFNTPVIALTANAISGMKEKYLNEGFSDYLSKPIDKQELNRVLTKFLG